MPLSQIERKHASIMFTYIVIMANIILGTVPFNNLADLHAKGVIDVLDIILVVNIILLPYIFSY